MTLLDFVRGPGLYYSLLIATAGLCWRLAGIWLLYRERDLSASRANLAERLRKALAVNVIRMFPKRAFWERTAPGTLLSYTFHLGLVLILFCGAPHILLWKAALGISWPALPRGIVIVVSGLTLGALIAVAVRRMRHPVLRLLSNFDDWLSLALTIAVVLSGMLLASEAVRGRYELMLALHILALELLLVWLPFGKLAHVALIFVSRATLGARFARKGAAI